VGKVDFVVFVLAPLGAGLALAAWGPPIKNVGGVLGGVAVFTALLFAMLTNVFNLSVKLRRDEGVRPEERLALNVDELFFNVGWSVLVGLILILCMTGAAVTHSASQRLGFAWVAILVSGLLHLVLTVIMAIVRMVSAYLAIGDLAPKRVGGTDPVATGRRSNAA